MAYRTRSSSAYSFVKSKKAQFFIITTITIVTMIFFMSKWMEPYTIIDTSSVVLKEQPFLLNNIVEKADVTVAASSPEDLEYNLQEYMNFITDYAAKKGFAADTQYQILYENMTGHPTAVVFSCLRLKSPDMITRNCHAT